MADAEAIIACVINRFYLYGEILFGGGYSAYITFPICLIICYIGTTFKYNNYVLLLLSLHSEISVSIGNCKDVCKIT